MTEKERIESDIEEIPGTLIEAVSEMEKDPFMREVLGDHVYEKYIAAKKQEWQDYRSQVTDWELNRYLNQY